MFLQVFADGTVIDSEGVHRLRAADLKPIMELVQSGELTRTRGHCGAPATDFIEYVNVVIYERRLGRLNGALVLVLRQSPGLRSTPSGTCTRRSKTCK